MLITLRKSVEKTARMLEVNLVMELGNIFRVN